MGAAPVRASGQVMWTHSWSELQSIGVIVGPQRGWLCN